MSAPKTDLEKQERRHKAPLLGMSTGVIVVLVLLIAFVVYLSLTGNEPGNETPIEAEAAAGAEAE